MCFNQLRLNHPISGLGEETQNLAPADQAEVVIDAAGEGDLVSFIGADRLGKLYANGVTLDVDDSATERLTANIDHELLFCLEAADLGHLALGTLGLDTEQSLEEVIGDFQFSDDLGHFAWMANDLSDQLIGTSETRIHLQADSDQTTRNSVHQLVVISLQRDDLGLNLAPSNGTRPLILVQETRPNAAHVANFEHSLKNGASSDAAPQLFGIRARVVDVERSDDDHLRRRHEVAHGDWDTADVIDDDIDVVLLLCRNRNDGRPVGDGARNKLLDILLLLDADFLILNDDVDLVLKNNDLIEGHDLDSSQVLRGLRLRAGLVGSDQQEG